MKQTHSTYPAFLSLCLAIAAIGAAPLSARADVTGAAKVSKSDSFVNQTDRLIVKYKDATMGIKGVANVPALTSARLAHVLRAGQQFGVTMRTLHTISTGAHILKLDRRMTVAEVAALAKDLAERDPNVEYAEPDRMMRKMSTPNDPRYSEQWQYYETTAGLRLPAAWDKSTGSGIVVGIIDTGYRPHVDLAGQILQGYDFISDAAIANDGNGRDPDAQDTGDAVKAGACGTNDPEQDETSSWHGTHVAGTIAALTNNSVGVAGVAYGARIVPARVLGKCGGYTSDIADAITWVSGGTVAGVPANANKARVINMSLGGDGPCDTTTQNAINGARSRGTVVVVAAGNESHDASNSNPANCAGVIAVAAVDRSGGRAWYSNYGSVVDVAAPGGDTSVTANGILSTLNAGTGAPGADSYAFYQGTSMATPHVAGVVALMLSRNPGLTPDDVEAKLKASTRAFPASCSGCGTGLVDANAAVNSVVIVESMFETESNNTTSTANPVTVNGANWLGNLSSNTDTDYFVVQLPAGKTLSAQLTPFTSGQDFDLYIYNSSGSQIAMSENGAGQVDSASVTNTGTTTVARYVRVKYYSGGTGSTNGKYTLKMAW
jgi:serine protease